MFYSTVILTKKGTLGQIWIAAHWDNKLSKKQIKDIIVSKSVHDIESPPVALSLRLTAHLLLGITRIYKKKVTFLQMECEESSARILNNLMQKSLVQKDVVTASDTDINLNSSNILDDTLDFDITLDMNQSMDNWVDIDKDPSLLNDLLNVTSIEFPRQDNSDLNMSIEEPREMSSFPTLDSTILPPLDSTSSPMKALDPLTMAPESVDIYNDTTTLPPMDIPAFDLGTTIQDFSVSGVEALNQNESLGPNGTNNNTTTTNNNMNKNTIQKTTRKPRNSKKRRLLEDNSIEYPERLLKRRLNKQDMETKDRMTAYCVDSMTSTTVDQQLNQFMNVIGYNKSIQSLFQTALTSFAVPSLQNSIPISATFSPIHPPSSPRSLEDIAPLPLPSFYDNDQPSLFEQPSIQDLPLNHTLDDITRNEDDIQDLNETYIAKQEEHIHKFKTVVENALEEANEKPVSWNTISHSASKKTAAKCFFALMALKSQNIFDIQQNEPFEDILISKTL
ncbi:hypothetical protein WA158_007131 [Blastocystis sp. Blastoise]